MLRTDLSHYQLRCPWCFGEVKAVISREDQTPHSGDFFNCPCGETGVLRDHDTYRRRWYIAKPRRI